jgi:CRP-like cAMP-binding protein
VRRPWALARHSGRAQGRRGSDDTLTGINSAWVSVLPDVIGEAFPHSREEVRRALAAAATVRVFRPGRAIVQQGDETSLALILNGHVALRRTTVDGRQLIMRIAGRGEIVSILPLAARPASADALALTASPAAVWRGNDVRSLARADPGFAVDILDQVIATFEEVVGRLDGLLYQNALRRVARVLLHHSDLFFAERPVLTRAHLPVLVGTSREMTGRVLRVLEARGLVARVGRSRLRLLDRAGLVAIAAGDEAPGDALGQDSASGLTHSAASINPLPTIARMTPGRAVSRRRAG